MRPEGRVVQRPPTGRLTFQSLSFPILFARGAKHYSEHCTNINSGIPPTRPTRQVLLKEVYYPRLQMRKLMPREVK